jgi:hypothetical protein
LIKLELLGGKHFYFYISELEYENQPVLPPWSVELKINLQKFYLKKKEFMKAMWGEVEQLITTKSTNGNVWLF